MPSPLTVTATLLEYIEEHPGLSATQLVHALGGKAGTISSALYTLFRAGILTRTPNAGPRGGYAYFAKEDEGAPRLNAWEWLLADKAS